MKTVSSLYASALSSAAASVRCGLAHTDQDQPAAPSARMGDSFGPARLTTTTAGRVRRDYRLPADRTLSGLFDRSEPPSRSGSRPASRFGSRPSTLGTVNTFHTPGSQSPSSSPNTSVNSRTPSRSSSWIRRLSSLSSSLSAPTTPKPDHLHPHCPTSTVRRGKLVKRQPVVPAIASSPAAKQLRPYTTGGRDALRGRSQSMDVQMRPPTAPPSPPSRPSPPSPPSAGWKSYFSSKSSRTGGRKSKQPSPPPSLSNPIAVADPIAVTAAVPVAATTAIAATTATPHIAPNLASRHPAMPQPSDNDKGDNNSPSPDNHDRRKKSSSKPRKSFSVGDLIHLPWRRPGWSRKRSGRSASTAGSSSSASSGCADRAVASHPSTSPASPTRPALTPQPARSAAVGPIPVVLADLSAGLGTPPSHSFPVDTDWADDRTPVQDNRRPEMSADSHVTPSPSRSPLLISDSSELAFSSPDCRPRTTQSRPLSTSHARSHSVPVVHGNTPRTATARFGTWGVGCTAVSEDWDDDFDFADDDDDDENYGGITNVEADADSNAKVRADSGMAMLVPHAIRAQQGVVRANISLLRDWGLLIEELKTIRDQAVAYGLPVDTPIWAEADAMIELADHESDEQPMSWSTPPSSPSIDLDDFDEPSPSPSDRRRKRQPRKSVLANTDIFSDPASLAAHDSAMAGPSSLAGASPVLGSPMALSPIRSIPFPTLPMPSPMQQDSPVPTGPSLLAPPANIITRPRQDSEALARTVIQALQRRATPVPIEESIEGFGTPVVAPLDNKKVPFDTATLKHIVPYLSRLVNSVRKMVDGAACSDGMVIPPASSPRRSELSPA